MINIWKVKTNYKIKFWSNVGFEQKKKSIQFCLSPAKTFNKQK